MNKMIIFAGKLDDMKKVTELKDGMKVWIPFQVREEKEVDNYPFSVETKDGIDLSLTIDCRLWKDNPPLEIYEQEEIPLLTPVKMEVSDNGKNWFKKDVFGKIHDVYVTEILGCFNFARPIQKTVTLEIPESELTDELRKYLKG